MHVLTQLVRCIGKWLRIIFDSLPNRIDIKIHNIYTVNIPRSDWLFNRSLLPNYSILLLNWEGERDPHRAKESVRERRKFESQCSYIFPNRTHCKYESMMYLGQNYIHVRHTAITFWPLFHQLSCICQRWSVSLWEWWKAQRNVMSSDNFCLQNLVSSSM